MEEGIRLLNPDYQDGIRTSTGEATLHRHSDFDYTGKSRRPGASEGASFVRFLIGQQEEPNLLPDGRPETSKETRMILARARSKSPKPYVPRLLPVASVFVLAATSIASAGTTSVEFSDFSDARRVGVEPFVYGVNTVIVGFDLRPDGTPIPPGSVINTAFLGAGIRLSARLTNGPYAGLLADAQSLDFSQAPNFGGSVSMSPPNILSALDPVGGPNASGAVAGVATLVVTFVNPAGQPALVHQVGAFNDLLGGSNTLSAYSGLDGTGELLNKRPRFGITPGHFLGVT